jgi:D-glycero-alpha-D-manno-heptose-7-phosphate kinase
VISSDLRAVETWEDIACMGVKGSELEIPLSIMKDLGCAVSVNLFLASEIPPGTGLGSSASVCVNVLKTLTTYLGVPMSKYQLAERAFQIARNALGKPVGKQDEYAATFGGINFIQFNSDESVTVEPLDLDPELVRELQSNLMLFFTGAAHHSWTILKEQEQSTNRSGMAVESLHQIRELADTMLSTLKAGNLDDFGELLHKGWEAKKRVSDKISTSHIDQMYGQARVHGATGGKITGAGGGGFLLLYCRQDAQQSVRECLTKMGAREMSFDFDFQGAQVVVDDPFIDADERGGIKWTFEPVRDQVSAASFSRS